MRQRDETERRGRSRAGAATAALAAALLAGVAAGCADSGGGGAPVQALALQNRNFQDGRLGVAYQAGQDIRVTGGTPPYTVTITRGALPTGMSFAGLELTGTPASTGDHDFRVTVTDSSSPPQQGARNYDVEIDFYEDRDGEAAGDRFGAAVARLGDVDGDGVDDLIVGAPFHDVGANADAGRVYVVSGRTGVTVWTIDGGSAGERFGTAVAGAGDVDMDGRADLLVGAPKADYGGADAGRVYVISGGTSIAIRTHDGTAGDELGTSVAGLGDIDGDMRSDYVLGAPFDDNTFANAGAAIVHSGSTGAVLYTFDGDSIDDNLGAAVGGGGDVNADTVPDVVVGAPNDDFGGADAGRIYVYSGQNGALILNLAGTAGQALGSSVAILPDVNFDGYADVVAGAPLADVGGTDAGRIVLVSGRDQVALLTVDGANAGDLYGSFVAHAGDVDADGFGDVAVGIPGFDNADGDVDAGRLQVLAGINGTVIGNITGADPGDQVGFAGAGADLDGDGYSDVVAGAPTEDDNGADAGRVRWRPGRGF